jgi:hypothetical protein
MLTDHLRARLHVSLKHCTFHVSLISMPLREDALRSDPATSRRSGRLAGHGPVEYNERVLAGVLNDECASHSRAVSAPFRGRWGAISHKPEVYTEVHVKALGMAHKEWKLFQDGYCQSTGKRVRTSDAQNS